MLGEAAVSDPIGLAWAASLASIAVAVVAAGHAVVYKRDPRSARRGAAHQRRHCPPARWPSVCVTAQPVCSPDGDSTFEEHGPWKKNQWNTGYWIVALLLLLSLQSYWQTAKTVEPVPYSEFEKALAEGRVAEVLVSDRTVTGRLKSPDSRGKTTIVATRVEPDLAERLSKYDVPYARVVESTLAA